MWANEAWQYRNDLCPATSIAEVTTGYAIARNMNPAALVGWTDPRTVCQPTGQDWGETFGDIEAVQAGFSTEPLLASTQRMVDQRESGDWFGHSDSSSDTATLASPDGRAILRPGPRHEITAVA